MPLTHQEAFRRNKLEGRKSKKDKEAQKNITTSSHHQSGNERVLTVTDRVVINWVNTRCHVGGLGWKEAESRHLPRGEENIEKCTKHHYQDSIRNAHTTKPFTEGAPTFSPTRQRLCHCSQESGRGRQWKKRWKKKGTNLD